MNYRIRFITAIILAVSGLSCTSGDTESATPVATPNLTVSRQQVPLGSPIEATFRFDIAADAPGFDQSYRVLVHFLDSDEELMWTDDHDPPVPTTEWQAGETIAYSRTMFVPIYPYVGEAAVHVGLYSVTDGRRLPLAGPEAGQRSYRVGTLELLPQAENVFLIFRSGWHRAEIAQDNAAVEWHWTKDEATIAFRNPRRDCLFYLHLDGRPDVFPSPQQVTITLGDQNLDTFTLSSKDEIIRRVMIGAAQLGQTDMVELKIRVDKTFVPALLPALASPDSRELGVRVFHAYVEPR